MSEEKVLMIVESPNKVKTLKEFLPSNYVVMASVGHVTMIADTGKYKMGIDVDNNFEVDYKIDPKKKDVVKLLKENVKLADKVILATDPDKEGEAIAKHLKDVLKISDDKYVRVTYHEITKSAVEEALKHPTKIDYYKATSAITRQILDKIVGYRVSPVVLHKVSARSAGRVQSAALKVLALREKEINEFISNKYYEIFLPFEKSNKIYECQYKGTIKKKSVTIKSKEVAEKIVSECIPGNYIVSSIEDSERTVKSKLPFTTSSFQQAVSSLLGYAPKKAMECAQKLFEGIQLNGKHEALITYIRTDSTTMSSEFADKLEKFVKAKYGKEYYAPVKKGKKSKNSQEAHECIRCVDLEMTPDKLSEYISDTQLLKVYKIIYERTVAASMSDCIMIDSEYSILNGEHKFAFTKHSVKFDGFKKVYTYKEDEDDEKFPSLKLNEKVNDRPLKIVEKETQPPSRYSEASLIKKLEELGIGRPSTYATICNILTDSTRGYTEKVGKSLKVTEKGMKLSKFLDEAFGDIINLSYTSEMEKSLDEIADGKLDNIKFLNEFYDKLKKDINRSSEVAVEKAPVEFVNKKCPKCGSELVYRQSRYGKFIACSSYPKCKYSEAIEDPNKPKKEEPVKVGVKCPKCKADIVIRKNSSGEKFYACSGYPKHKKIFTELEIKKLAEDQSIDINSIDKS